MIFFASVNLQGSYEQDVRPALTGFLCPLRPSASPWIICPPRLTLPPALLPGFRPLFRQQIFFFRTGILRLYHQDWNFVTVKTGDILFSNDGFGQHYASETLFNDAVDQAELCRKYGSDFAEAGK